MKIEFLYVTFVYALSSSKHYFKLVTSIQLSSVLDNVRSNQCQFYLAIRYKIIKTELFVH